MAPKRSGGDGRKKSVLRRIGKLDARHVCFSKRKRGLFSKASALALLTGAQVAAVVFSPGGKAFSFGHSSVDAVVNRFMAGGAEGVQGPADDNRLQELDRQDGKMRAELAERRKRKKRADEALNKERAKGDQIASWLHPDMRGKGYDYEDMAAFETALMQVQAAVSGRANQVLVELFGASTFELGSSSNSNVGIEMQHMQMATHPPQGFAAGMEMQMPMHPPQGFAAGMEMQMAIPQQSGFTGGVETEMLMTMLPATPEFPAGMDLPQQGLGPNPGYPH